MATCLSLCTPFFSSSITLSWSFSGRDAQDCSQIPKTWDLSLAMACNEGCSVWVSCECKSRHSQVLTIRSLRIPSSLRYYVILYVCANFLGCMLRNSLRNPRKYFELIYHTTKMLRGKWHNHLFAAWFWNADLFWITHAKIVLCCEPVLHEERFFSLLYSNIMGFYPVVDLHLK